MARDERNEHEELGRFRGVRLRRAELLAEIDSTNREAFRRVERADFDEVRDAGLVLIAERQTAGHGSRGRAWSDRADKSLAMTALLAWPADWPLAAATWAGAIAVADALRELGLPTRLKWPNDVLVPERAGDAADDRGAARKIAGILAETRSPGRVALVALGIGLNVGQSPSDFPPGFTTAPTSLAMEGRAATVADAALRLLHALDRHLGAGPAAIAATFRAGLGLVGQTVELERADGTITGRLDALTDDGVLIVDGIRHHGGHVLALRSI